MTVTVPRPSLQLRNCAPDGRLAEVGITCVTEPSNGGVEVRASAARSKHQFQDSQAGSDLLLSIGGTGLQPEKIFPTARYFFGKFASVLISRICRTCRCS